MSEANSSGADSKSEAGANGQASANSVAKTVSGPPGTVNSQTLDRSKVETERRAATGRLLARLKAIDSTQDAQTSRAFASRYIREQEPLILRLLDAGVAMQEILANLLVSFPSIPKADLRFALEQLRERLRDRRRKQVGPGSMTFAEPRASSESRTSGSTIPTGSVSRATGQHPDEFDEYYRLCQALEESEGKSVP